MFVLYVSTCSVMGFLKHFRGNIVFDDIDILTYIITMLLLDWMLIAQAYPRNRMIPAKLDAVITLVSSAMHIILK